MQRSSLAESIFPDIFDKDFEVWFRMSERPGSFPSLQVTVTTHKLPFNLSYFPTLKTYKVHMSPLCLE